MKLENIKLIHTLNDVPITYNNNETLFENVFILDKNNNNINGITYTCPIYFDECVIENNILNKQNLCLENVFLFYSFFCQIAFGHFIEQTLPKINYYLKLKSQINDLKLCIPKKRYNLLTDNIIKLLNICEENILVLDHDIIINATNLFYNNYECADFNTDKIETFNLIREKLLINNNVSFNRNVYIKRNIEPITDTDCYNIGKTREIVNEELLINNLKKLNFEIITLGENDIDNKKNLLSNINILITQTGGAMYNLIFSNTPKDIIFLSNTYPLHADYINNLLPKLNFYTPNSMKIFSYNSYINNCDIKNFMNDPFIVDIDEIITYCNEL
jgi:capsular polysaccharide biosynthesis protein